VIDNVLGRLNQMAANQGLKSYQKVCAAMCVASRIIRYSTDSILAKFDGPSAVVERASGSCTDFAQIGAALINGVGVHAWVRGSFSEAHAFVKVTFQNDDGKSYYVEPQLDTSLNSCEFWNSDIASYN
jgi:transglutaminase-like putative cysteine protease